MKDSGILPINFTISLAAKQEIEKLRQFNDSQTRDKAVVTMIAWGRFESNSGQSWENVVVGFYGQSQYDEVAHGIQDASGLPVVFFTTANHHSKFAGKIVDHVAERGFFLRDP